MNSDALPPPFEEATRRPRSVGSLLMNIFVDPGEVFEEVKASPHRVALWLAPTLLACLLGAAYSVTIFSTESLAQQMREAQERRMQKQVDAGKLSREQAAQAVAMMEKFKNPALMSVLGSGGAAAAAFAGLFLSASVIWLIGAYGFKARFAFSKAIEVSGLAGMVGALGSLIQIPLTLGVGRLAVSPGPSLFIQEFNPQSLPHQLALMCNVLTLWQIGVTAAGLAKLSGVSWLKAAAWLYGIWAVLVLGFTTLSCAVSRL
jgi:hypothetical protein